MRLLLDSHAFLCWLADDPTLHPTARWAIAEPDAVVHVSAATVLEIAIKAALGRIDVGGADIVAEIAANGFDELPITGRHAALAGALPRLHDDPFDRMLIAQARLQGLTLVTRDKAFEAYDISILRGCTAGLKGVTPRYFVSVPAQSCDNRRKARAWAAGSPAATRRVALPARSRGRPSQSVMTPPAPATIGTRAR